MVNSFSMIIFDYKKLILKIYICFKGLEMCNKDKLLSIATCIFNNFANSADLANIVVPTTDSDEIKIVNMTCFIFINFNKQILNRIIFKRFRLHLIIWMLKYHSV